MKEAKYCKENKKTLEFFKENKEVIITAPTFIITVLGILYGIIRYFYSLKAEQFYGIPKFYFYDNLQVEYIVNVAFFVTTIMLLFSPFMIKRFLKKNKLKFFESLVYSFLFAFLAFYLSLVFCVSFIMNPLHITGYDYILLFVCIVVAIISWVVYFFVFKTDLIKHSIDKQKTKEDKNKEDALVEPKTKKNIILLAFAIVTTTIIVIIMVLMFNSTLFTPNNKKNYEIIQVDKSEYNVIVGYYKNLAIIMKGKIRDSNSHLEIKKGYYKLESVEEKNLGYYSFYLVNCED